MTQELINKKDNTPKSGMLPIALYPNAMSKSADRESSYYAGQDKRPVLRQRDTSGQVRHGQRFQVVPKPRRRP